MSFITKNLLDIDPLFHTQYVWTLVSQQEGKQIRNLATLVFFHINVPTYQGPDNVKQMCFWAFYDFKTCFTLSQTIEAQYQ